MANTRNTIAYFKKQSSALTAVVPTSNTDGYVSIEKPDVTTGQRELLESELLSGNIGKKKPQLGVETSSASVTLELRSHGDTSSPTEPDFGDLLEEGIGELNISTAETVQASPAPSTTEFGISTEGNIKRYDFFILNNATDGRIARFVKEMKIDVIAGTNDDIDFNEGGGELNASVTPGTYIHGGSADSGSIGEAIKTALEAAGADTYTVTEEEQADGSFKYTISSDGTTLSFLNNTGTNTATNLLKLNLGFGTADLTGALSYEAASACWGNRVVCNVAMDNAPTAADVVNASVNYKPGSGVREFLTAGFYQGNSSSDGYLEQVIGALVASMELNIETGSIVKLSAELQGLTGDRIATTAAPHTPSYEDIQGLVAFDVESYFDDTLVCANAATISIENEITQKRSYCVSGGYIGAEVRSRGFSGTINPYIDGSVDYFDALNNLTDYRFMLVVGVKDSGGFVVGKTVGVYMPQIMFSQDKTSDIDDLLIEDINFQAHTGASGNKVEFAMGLG